MPDIYPPQGDDVYAECYSYYRLIGMTQITGQRYQRCVGQIIRIAADQVANRKKRAQVDFVACTHFMYRFISETHRHVKSAYHMEREIIILHHLRIVFEPLYPVCRSIIGHGYSILRFDIKTALMITAANMPTINSISPA